VVTAAMPRLDASEQRIALTLTRRLALGVPASAGGAAAAADPSEAQIIDALARPQAIS
jgi:hypothetical protein